MNASNAMVIMSAGQHPLQATLYTEQEANKNARIVRKYEPLNAVSQEEQSSQILWKSGEYETLIHSRDTRRVWIHYIPVHVCFKLLNVILFATLPIS